MLKQLSCGTCHIIMERTVMKSKFGTFCMVLGAALVLGALALFCMNQKEAKEAAASVEEILPKLVDAIENPNDAGGDENELESEAETEHVYPNPYDMTMTEKMIDGYAYIGYLTLPKLGLELPVMASWDYTRLRIAPCRYTGSTKSDDLVIMAHNYASHFGGLSSLSAGDAVYFTDMDGYTSQYLVVALDVLSPTAVEEMTDGGYDLTLFTCTYGGKSRVTVRCEQVTANGQ